MKILIINTNDIYGGAARAAFRLHKALLRNGIDSRMLVANKKSDENTIITVENKNLIEKIFNETNKIMGKIVDKVSLVRYKKTMSKNFGLFSSQITSNNKLIKNINKINPDIVHLHWICDNFLSIENLAEINSPIVWSLHDMWAFTGGCHYVAGNDIMCDGYARNCGNCDLLGSKKSKDLSFRVLKRKIKIFNKIKSMNIIGLSKWLQDCAKNSSVFWDKEVINLPNLIDSAVFCPYDMPLSRKLFGLPETKKLVLFGAVSATSVPYKGFTELVEALKKINSENVEFVVFGSSEPENAPCLPCKVHYLGCLYDDVTLVALYNACNVMVVPSKRENLSNTIMESLSCGTPVVCFDIGGNSDLIDHKINGYLAKPGDTSDLAEGIDWVLNYENYSKLSDDVRKKTVLEFDYNVVIKKYINIYKNIMLHNNKV